MEQKKETEPFATELLRQVKENSKRWFIAFIVTLLLWFATIGGFLWYISLPVEDFTGTTIESNDDGNANYINGTGDINNGEDNSN